MIKFWTDILCWLGLSPMRESVAVPAVLEAEQPPPSVESFLPESAWWLVIEGGLLEQPRVHLDGEPIDPILANMVQGVLEHTEVELPHLPHVPQRVMSELRRSDVNFPKIAEILSHDQTLTAAVMSMGNSAAYGAEVTNILVALSRLGMRNIRNLMLRESVKAITVRRTADGSSKPETLWRKSVASAVMMEKFAPLFNLQPEEAFLMGLLHDIGEVVLLRVVHDYYRTTKNSVPDAHFLYLCQCHHEHLGGALAAHWHLPDVIQKVIQGHHACAIAGEELGAERCLLQITDMLCALMGHGERQSFAVLRSHAAEQIGFGQHKSHIDLLEDLPELVRQELES